MINSYWVIPDSVDDIAHYGVKGMKWGVRRYQNEDGTLTSLGKRREDLKNVQRRPAKGAQEKAKRRSTSLMPLVNSIKKRRVND